MLPLWAALALPFNCLCGFDKLPNVSTPLNSHLVTAIITASICQGLVRVQGH